MRELALLPQQASVMTPLPIPTRVALLEERQRRTDEVVTSMDGKLDEILLALAQRKGRDGVFSGLGHLVTVVISGSVAAIISLVPSLWKRGP